MQRTCTGSRFEIRFTLWLPEAMPHCKRADFNPLKISPPKKKAEGLEDLDI